MKNPQTCINNFHHFLPIQPKSCSYISHVLEAKETSHIAKHVN